MDNLRIMGNFCGVKWNKSDKQKTVRIVVWYQKLLFCHVSIKKKMCYISCDGPVWVYALRIHTVEITGLLMTNLAAQQDDEFVPFHPHLPLLLPALVNEPWLRSLHFDWHLASSKSGCDHDVLWSSHLFFVRARHLFKFLCTVTFRICRLVHHCLPSNMKEEAFLLTTGACFTSAFIVLSSLSA